MPDVSQIKNAGLITILSVIDAKGLFDYPTEYDGASANFGINDNELVIHLTGSPNENNANNILTAAALPTCTSSLLDITTNLGTYISNDVTSVVADPNDEKFVKISIVIDDVSGDIEAIAFEKTTEIYGDIPAGKTFCCDLKEFSVPAAGTTLTEVKNFIK